MSEAAPQGSKGEMVLYTTEDGCARFFLRAQAGMVWLTQSQLAELFQTTPQNIGRHVKNVLAQKELCRESAVKEGSASAFGRKRRVRLYNLEMALAVGYRVKSARAVQFRQWATARLRDYLLKGYALDDDRLQNPHDWDYFDELMLRIRAIRASDSRFFQKIRELLSLSVDYTDDPGAASAFFAEALDKMLYAVTRHTAAEIVVMRCDASHPELGFEGWSGRRVDREHVVVARNYLKPHEVQDLNLIVTRFLDFAEARASKRTRLRLADWREYLDSFLDFSERPILPASGCVAHEDMVLIAHARYAEFEARRRRVKRELEDALELAELEEAMRTLQLRRAAHA